MSTTRSTCSVEVSFSRLLSQEQYRRTRCEQCRLQGCCNAEKRHGSLYLCLYPSHDLVLLPALQAALLLVLESCATLVYRPGRRADDDRPKRTAPRGEGASDPWAFWGVLPAWGSRREFFPRSKTTVWRIFPVRQCHQETACFGASTRTATMTAESAAMRGTAGKAPLSELLRRPPPSSTGEYFPSANASKKRPVLGGSK